MTSPEQRTPVRTVVVWCPDWPITAAGVPPDRPVAVMAVGHVVACSAAARADGVRRGLRGREAQLRCPTLQLLPADHRRDTAAFETVLATVERFTDRLEVVRAGVCAFRARGPSRIAGGDEPLATQVARTVGRGCRVGVSEGLFAAGLAARQGVVVPPGTAREFLADWPVDTLNRPELCDLLVRLGIRTLGGFAALPVGAVLARFGTDGARAHRLASGLDERPLAPRRPGPELAVHAELDPPLDRIDTVAFTVKSLADELHGRLASHCLICTRVAIEVQTAHGERLRRMWRHGGEPSSAAITDRARWQLEGWLSDPSGGADRPTGGICLLRLTADEVAPADGRQLDLWETAHTANPAAGPAEATMDRVSRAIARVQGMLGHHAVTTAVPRGGRGHAERTLALPWGDSIEPSPTAAQPWPGQLPPPSPATVHPQPPPTQVTDPHDVGITVSGRHAMSGVPTWIRTVDGRRQRVTGWVGPWPVDERWWDAAGRCRRARLQVCTAEGTAFLLALDNGQWRIEAEYD